MQKANSPNDVAVVDNDDMSVEDAAATATTAVNNAVVVPLSWLPPDVYFQMCSYLLVSEAGRLATSSKRQYYLVHRFRLQCPHIVTATSQDHDDVYQACRRRLYHPPTLAFSVHRYSHATHEISRGLCTDLSPNMVALGITPHGGDSDDDDDNLEAPRESLLLGSFHPHKTQVHPFRISPFLGHEIQAQEEWRDELPSNVEFKFLMVFVVCDEGEQQLYYVDSILSRLQERYPQATVVGSMIKSGFVAFPRTQELDRERDRAADRELDRELEQQVQREALEAEDREMQDDGDVDGVHAQMAFRNAFMHFNAFMEELNEERRLARRPLAELDDERHRRMMRLVDARRRRQLGGRPLLERDRMQRHMERNRDALLERRAVLQEQRRQPRPPQPHGRWFERLAQARYEDRNRNFVGVYARGQCIGLAFAGDEIPVRCIASQGFKSLTRPPQVPRSPWQVYKVERAGSSRRPYFCVKQAKHERTGKVIRSNIPRLIQEIHPEKLPRRPSYVALQPHNREQTQVYHFFDGSQVQGQDSYILPQVDGLHFFLSKEENSPKVFQKTHVDVFLVDRNASRQHIVHELTRIKEERRHLNVLGAIVLGDTDRKNTLGITLQDDMNQARSVYPKVDFIGATGKATIGPPALPHNPDIFSSGGSRVRRETAMLVVFVTETDEEDQLNDSEENVSRFVRNKLQS